MGASRWLVPDWKEAWSAMVKKLATVIKGLPIARAVKLDACEKAADGHCGCCSAKSNRL